MEPADHTSSDESSVERLLVQYDEALSAAASLDSGTLDGSSIAGSSSLPEEQARFVQAAMDCLRLLELERRLKRFSPIKDNTAGSRSSLVSQQTVLSMPGDQEAHAMHSEADLPLRLGRFELLRPIGRGGFGIVYLAHDPVLHRLVAIKIPLLHRMTNPENGQRFLREGQLAATLAHPHLVPTYEAGQEGGVSYQVTAYCAGGSLAAWLKGGGRNSDSGPGSTAAGHPQRQLPISDAAQLMIGLAEGVQHAHDHGILHRDLNPNNVLLHPKGERFADLSLHSVHEITPVDFVKQLQPMIADFGLAKRFDQQDLGLLETEQLLDSSRPHTSLAGTPQYMAPEQVDPNIDSIGRHTDVYGLGTILYEVLAGRPAFPRLALHQLQPMIRLQMPPSLRTLRPEIPLDLQAICERCLQKSVRDRYASARELADDLRAYLRGERVNARPWPLHEQVTRWAMHRPLVASLLVACACLLLGVLGIGAWHLQELGRLNSSLAIAIEDRQRQADNATRAQQLALINAETAEAESLLALQLSKRSEELAWVASQGEYAAKLSRASRQYNSRQIGQASRTLQEISPYCQPLPSMPAQPTFEWRYLWNQVASQREFVGLEAIVLDAAITSDSQTVHAISFDGTVKVWDANTARLLDTWRYCDVQPSLTPHMNASISADGRTAVVADLGSREFPDKLYSLDLEHRRVANTIEPPEIVNCMALTPDGQWAILGSSLGGASHLYVWSLRSGALIVKDIENLFEVAGNSIDAIAVSEKGDTIAITVHTAQADPATPIAEAPSPLSQFLVAQLAVSESGVALSQVRTFQNRVSSPVKYVTFSDDVSKLAVVLLNAQKIEIWDLLQGNLLDTIEAPLGLLPVCEFTENSKRLLINIAQIDDEPGLTSTQPSPGQSPKVPVAARAFPALMEYDLTDRTLHKSGFDSKRPINSMNRVAAPSSWLISDSSGRVSLWTQQRTLPYQELVAHPGSEVWCVAYSPDGQTLYSAGDDWSVRAWDMRTLGEIRSSTVHESLVSCLAISPDGQWLASGSYDNQIVVWWAQDLSVQAVLQGHTGHIKSLAFSTDGRYLATGGRDRKVRLWSIPDGQLIDTYTTHGTPRSLAFTSDSRVIASDDGGSIWSLEVGKEGEQLLRDYEEIHSIAWAPEGGRWFAQENRLRPTIASIIDTPQAEELLLFGCKTGKFRVRHLPSGTNWLSKTVPTSDLRGLEFSPDGQTIAFATQEGNVHLWSVSAGQEVATLGDDSTPIHQIAFSPDGQSMAVARHDGTIRIYHAPHIE
jgi:WD40 repeat protein/serine/threonine protein kinase